MAGKRKIFSNILIVVGVLFVAIPSVLTFFNTQRNESIIDEFLVQSEIAVSNTDSLITEAVESFYIPEALPEHTSFSETPSNTSEASEFGANATASPSESNETSQASPPSPTKKPTMSKEEIRKRMSGVLIVDKIDLRMVIMDGVDEETLRVAAGRMPDTGNLDEIGNCVLAGHRSYTLGKYFNRLDELVVGDKITIQTNKKTLCYEVTKKYIVEPTDFSITEKNDTEKILTLFTCHPVAIATHRLVVQAKQTDE